jgi:hypothetical protein
VMFMILAILFASLNKKILSSFQNDWIIFEALLACVEIRLAFLLVSRLAR